MNTRHLLTEDTPLLLVQQTEKLCPDCYTLMDRKLREADVVEGTNPPACTYNALRIIHEHYSDIPAVNRETSSSIAAAYLWRKDKIVYQVDDTLSEALAQQAESMDDTDVLPTQLLSHLPHPAIYIKSDYFRRLSLPYDKMPPMDGFFAWIDDYGDDPANYPMGSSENLILLICCSGMIAAQAECLPLSGETLGDIFRAEHIRTRELIEENRKSPLSDGNARELEEYMKKLNQIVRICIQHLLYLLAANHEEAEDREQRQVRRRARERDKRVLKEDNVAAVSLINVGVRIGATLRQSGREESTAHNSSGGRKLATHYRRGHWHHFWIGKTDTDERKLVLKWIAPMLINPPKNDQSANMPVVVYPIKQNFQHPGRC